MAAPVSDSAALVEPVSAGWELCLTAAGACATPDDLAADWIPATVPGTAASALEAAGLWHRDRPDSLHDRDVWYRVTLRGHGPRRLRLGGLATIAEVWLDGQSILASDTMFLAHEVAVVLGGQSRLHIAFRSLTTFLAGRKGKRARWRTQMIPDQRLRFVRTTLLGHMPGWCPAFDAVGPYRPVELIEHRDEALTSLDLRTAYEGETGRLCVALAFATALSKQDDATVTCGGRTEPLRRDADGRLAAEMTLPGIAPWWPHTHGTPALHPVEIRIGGRRIDAGRVGFRRIALDRGANGQGLRLLVNDVPVFCRGAVWMPPDPVGLGSTRGDYEGSLGLAREAGINMLRVSGTTLYEGRAFHDLCDELGILVWQDAMLANFDYPADEAAFAASLRIEFEQLLCRLQASPSLAVLCGGSEVAQQAAMMGLPPSSWAGGVVVETLLPQAVAAWRPDTILVPSSPFGGPLPFQADAGCSHYYGVGAYRRPLEDARRAGVRFASECLAFANVPDAATLRDHMAVPAVHHPRWKEGVPRDLGASWDFEDVRDHYAALLYGIDPPRLRSEDPARYLALSRAAPADVMEATIAEWRRPGSPCAGALVLQWQDLRAGAGWGVLDALGHPKSVYHALKRAFRPVQVLIADEGVNGLVLHALNDGAAPVRAVLGLVCLRDGRLPVAAAERPVTIDARGSVSLPAAEMLGRFFDANYAYRFGPADHDLCRATLRGEDGALVAEASYWLPGRRSQRHHLDLAAVVEQDREGWLIRLSARRMAAAIAIDDRSLVAEDNHFDLPPGEERMVRLRPRPGASTALPDGEITAINALETLRYAAPGA